jgi:hypothetical protein
VQERLERPVTKARSTCVVIGSSTRAIAETSLDQPATQADRSRGDVAAVRLDARHAVAVARSR